MNAKIYNGNVQPNPKEYKIWVNDEGIIKTWNGTEWIEWSGGSGSDISKYKPIGIRFKMAKMGVNLTWLEESVCKMFSSARMYIGGSDDGVGPTTFITNGDIVSGDFVFLPVKVMGDLGMTVNTFEDLCKWLRLDDTVIEEIPVDDVYNSSMNKPIELIFPNGSVKEYACDYYMSLEDWLNSSYNIDGFESAGGSSLKCSKFGFDNCVFLHIEVFDNGAYVPVQLNDPIANTQMRIHLEQMPT